MLYQDYMRRKMHNVVKLDTKEGYPLTVYNCANKNLKDYIITGNADGVGDKTENVFNYTEPHAEAHKIADENGWFDVTIDNSSGGRDKEAFCFTKVNLDLKTNTNYYLVLEVAERTGDINIRSCNDWNSTSQFNTALRIDSPAVGIKPPQKIVSKSTFTDESIKYMLRTHAFCTSGKSGHIKFRIAVYETEKNYFEPYDKYKIPITVTGNNLFDKAISTNADIKNETTITSSAYSVPILNNNYICKILKPDTTYTISCEFECTAIPSDYTYSGGILGFRVHSNVSGYSSMDATIDKQMLVGETYKFSKNFTTPSNFGTGGNYGFYIYRNHYKGNGTIAASMICRKLQIEEGTSATSYEPYHKPITTNIFRDAQLGQGETINYKNDNLPDIVLKKGTNIITADTEVKPSSIKIKYLKK